MIKNKQVIHPRIFKVETGRDLLISLQEMAKKENKAGIILIIVVNLSKARIKCLGKKQSIVVKNILDIISLNGTIEHNNCHLHLSFSDGNCNLWPGHVERELY